MKRKLVSILMLAFKIVKAEIVGVKATPIESDYSYKLMQTTVEPTERLSFNDWCKTFKVSCRINKYQQINN